MCNKLFSPVMLVPQIDFVTRPTADCPQPVTPLSRNEQLASYKQNNICSTLAHMNNGKTLLKFVTTFAFPVG